MLILAATTDKIQLVTSAAVTVDVHASYVDHTTATDNVVAGRKNTAITTATTTDIVAVPAAGDIRNVKSLNIRNKHATTSVDVTVLYEGSTTDFDVELFKVTLLAGQTLEFVEGVGFFVVAQTAKLFNNLRVTADFVSAVTSFADITGLTCAVESGKHYGFEAHFFHFSNAATNGPRFAIGGVAMTAMRIQAIITETGSVAAGVVNTNIADVTAVDTAVQVTTDAQITTPVMSIMSGWFNPSAAGTFAFRGAAETAVAAALTVKTGSWAQVWEYDA